MKTNAVETTAITLTGIGAVNWGLVQFANFNLVTFLSKAPLIGMYVEPVVYGAVAISGVFVLGSVVYEKIIK